MSYLQIADDITARIASGEYPPGSALPSYSQLADIYSVSVPTITRVQMVLRLRGLTEAQQGRAVYVTDRAESGK